MQLVLVLRLGADFFGQRLGKAPGPGFLQPNMAERVQTEAGHRQRGHDQKPRRVATRHCN